MIIHRISGQVNPYNGLEIFYLPVLVLWPSGIQEVEEWLQSVVSPLDGAWTFKVKPGLII